MTRVNEIQLDAVMSQAQLLTKDDLKIFKTNHLDLAENVDNELELISKGLSSQLSKITLLESKSATKDAVDKLDAELDTVYEHIDSNTEDLLTNQASLLLIETKITEMNKCHNESLQELKDKLKILENKLEGQAETIKAFQIQSDVKTAGQGPHTKVHDDPMSSKTSSLLPLDHVNPLNVIVEGLSEYSGEELYERILEIGMEININLNESMFHSIIRIGRQNDWPRPTKVEFVSRHMRNLFLGRGSMLIYNTVYYKVHIKPDKSMYKRVCKAKLRYAARVSRQKGYHVRLGPDKIQINSVCYTWEEVDSLPVELTRDAKTADFQGGKADPDKR